MTTQTFEAGSHDPQLDPLAGTCLICQGPLHRATESDPWQHDFDNTAEIEEELLEPATPNRDPNFG